MRRGTESRLRRHRAKMLAMRNDQRGPSDAGQISQCAHERIAHIWSHCVRIPQPPVRHRFVATTTTTTTTRTSRIPLNIYALWYARVFPSTSSPPPPIEGRVVQTRTGLCKRVAAVQNACRVFAGSEYVGVTCLMAYSFDAEFTEGEMRTRACSNARMWLIHSHILYIPTARGLPQWAHYVNLVDLLSSYVCTFSVRTRTKRVLVSRIWE